MALSLGILFSSSTKLTAEQRSTENRETDLNRQNRQGNQREQPAVDHHHKDVDHRESGIKNRRQCLTGEEISDFFQLSHPGSQFTHRPTIEIAQR